MEDKVLETADTGTLTSVPFRDYNLSVRIVIAQPDANQWILFLNGAGVGLSKDRFLPFHRAFLEAGISSISFDYVGVGKTGGDFADSSLADRVDQTLAVLDMLVKQYGAPAKLGLYGVSMGSYVALGVCNQLAQPVHKLILVTGAAYAPIAHTVHFGPEFTEILKSTPDGRPSWIESSSFEWLKESSGDVLLVVAEHDEIVPREISEKYRDVALGRPSGACEYHIIPGATHYIGRSGQEVSLAPKLVEFYKS